MTGWVCYHQPMTGIDRETCRKAAAGCIELARVTADSAKKEILLARAQEWVKLANAKNKTEFEQHLAQMNAEQMAPTHRQPMQQQSKTTRDDQTDGSR
jgi:hypothetical protein